jgi:hypothetical protein
MAVSFFVSSCGGSGSSGSDPALEEPLPTTGTVALLFTDRPTDEFSAIKLNVLEAILIGGDSVDGQQQLFEGVEPIDLLDLTNFNEPIIFGEVDAGIYTKLRLIIDDLELVPSDGGPSQFPALPANGKIDLLDPNGIEVLPGRTLIVEIDMEANKALKITGAGNSGRYQFRPVVKVNFMDGDAGVLPDKLARLEGTASNIDPAGTFTLCDIETPNSCVDVATNAGTSIFGNEGAPADFTALGDMAAVVVIGNYTVEGSIVLNAVILEIGGNAEQIKGQVVSDPMDDKFLLLKDDDTDIVVELQVGTMYYDENGMLGPDAVVLGTDVEVEGVQPPKAVDTDPDLIRAALVFIMAEEDEQVSGTIIEPLDPATSSFGLTLADGSGDICVRVDTDPAADVLLVDVTASEVTMAAFTNLYVGQVVDLFGVMNDCFDANEVIVDVNASPPPP